MVWRLKLPVRGVANAADRISLARSRSGRLPAEQRALLMPLWRLRAHMAFLVNNLQYYLQVDVLEAQWQAFMTVAETCADFEELTAAHEACLAALHAQCFLQARAQRPQSSRVHHGWCGTDWEVVGRWSVVAARWVTRVGRHSLNFPYCPRAQASSVSTALHQIFQLCLSLCRMLSYAERGARAETTYQAQFATVSREFSRQSAFLFAFLSNMSSPQQSPHCACRLNGAASHRISLYPVHTRWSLPGPYASTRAGPCRVRTPAHVHSHAPMGNA